MGDPKTKIGVVGLGKMGSQIAQRLAQNGFEVAATDVDQALVEALHHQNIKAVNSREALLGQLGEQPLLWLMIPQQFTGAEIDALLKLLPKNAIIIDGGNSRFEKTIERAAECKQQGVSLIDAGVSGGIHGLAEGFCIMVGGDDSIVKTVEPVFKALAQPGGYAHVGAAGMGHFVKMVHNGIEYGLMAAYADGYRLMHELYPELDLAQIAKLWQHGSVNRSWLNGLIAEIFQENPALDGIDGIVEALGEGQWTVETAKQQQISLPIIEEAVDARMRSKQGEINFGTKLQAALRTKFGGHSTNPSAKK